MNRFKTYLDSARLAKSLLIQAQLNLDKGQVNKAVRDTISAMQSFTTAMNNIGSLLKEPRRKIKLAHERKPIVRKPVVVPVVESSNDKV